MSVYYDLYQNPPKEGEQEGRLHARVVPKGTIPADKFLELVHGVTGFSPSILGGTLQAITDELQRWLADGWIVEVGELGHFSISLECDRPVMSKKDIRSPSIHFRNVNLRLGKRFRHRFVTMELERKASPYHTSPGRPEKQRLELLLKHLEQYGCITRADYSALTGRTKTQAQSDLNRYIEQGIIRKYGAGRTVVYLKQQKT